MVYGKPTQIQSSWVVGHCINYGFVVIKVLVAMQTIHFHFPGRPSKSMLDLELIYGVKLLDVSFGMGVWSELLDVLVSELDEVIGESILVYEHNRLNGTAQLMSYKKQKRVSYEVQPKSDQEHAL
jgi:hypothetical protein